MTDDDHRPRCLRCLRPEAMCYCATLPSVPTRTRIVVLQHPHERSHPFGTARLVGLCMPNASVHVPYAGFTGTLEQRVEVAPDAAVLYPHPDAPDLAELPSDRHPSTLIAIDGTWAHAKRLYRENTWLHAMPHVRLSPNEPSRYRIRREPRADYVSTLEAIVEALRILEPETAGLDDLLRAFDRMIDRQVDHFTNNEHVVRRRRPRQKEQRALSPLLADPRLCVVYAEASLPGDDPDDRDPTRPRDLLQWVAARLDGDEVFETLVRPATAMPGAHHLEHMGLDAAELAAAPSPDAARSAFAGFVGEGAPLAAWTGSTFDWGDALLPHDGERTLLKTSYCNHAHRRAGFLEEIVAREGLDAPPVACRGRAAARLGNALAVARWLRDQIPSADR
ncbi:MAG: DTW domain-containing protein [Planctomycetota bacterium]